MCVSRIGKCILLALDIDINVENAAFKVDAIFAISTNIQLCCCERAQRYLAALNKRCSVHSESAIFRKTIDFHSAALQRYAFDFHAAVNGHVGAAKVLADGKTGVVLIVVILFCF